MRWVVWMGVVGCIALSCARSKVGDSSAVAGAGSGSGAAGTSGGRSGDAGGPPETGGAAGSMAAAGRAGAGHGGIAGQGGTAGEQGTAGGRSGSSGDGGLGGAGGVAGAQSGTGGADDGGAGAAGAPDTGCGDYRACGCGCCEGSTPELTRCVYPELDQDLAPIVAADEAAASDPTCAAAECGRGVRHLCCESPANPGAATYTTSAYVGGYNRLSIKRTGADGRCTVLGLVQPEDDTDKLELELPSGWAVQAASDYACADENSAAADSRRQAIGGLGTLAFTTPMSCAVDFNFTLFFLSESGALEAVRFVGSGVDVPEFGGCP
jgi:hypothetical protein